MRQNVFTEDDATLEQVAWKGFGFSICGDSGHLSGCGPVAGCSSCPCVEQGGLTR